MVTLKRKSQNKGLQIFSFCLLIVLIFIVFIISLRYLISLSARSEAKCDLEGIRYTLKISKPVFQVGENIPLKLEIRNLSPQRRELKFRTSLEFDFIVQKNINWAVLNLPMDIWRYSANVVVQPRHHSLFLEPLERKIYAAVWDQKDHNHKLVLPGRYVITGIVSAEGKKTELQIWGRTKR